MTVQLLPLGADGELGPGAVPDLIAPLARILQIASLDPRGYALDDDWLILKGSDAESVAQLLDYAASFEPDPAEPKGLLPAGPLTEQMLAGGIETRERPSCAFRGDESIELSWEVDLYIASGLLAPLTARLWAVCPHFLVAASQHPEDATEETFSPEESALDADTTHASYVKDGWGCVRTWRLDDPGLHPKLIAETRALPDESG